METPLAEKLMEQLPACGLVIFVVWFLVNKFLAHFTEQRTEYLKTFNLIHEENVNARSETRRIIELKSVAEGETAKANIEVAKAITMLGEAVRAFQNK